MERNESLGKDARFALPSWGALKVYAADVPDAKNTVGVNMIAACITALCLAQVGCVLVVIDRCGLT